MFPGYRVWRTRSWIFCKVSARRTPHPSSS
jgi:hypothetical protein